MLEYMCDKRRNGFSLAGAMILLLVVSAMMAASITLLSKMSNDKTKISAYTKDCIVNEGAADLGSLACDGAIDGCRYGLEKDCDTLFFYADTYETATYKVAKAICDLNGQKACKFLMDQCVGDANDCDLDTTNNLNDIVSYLDDAYSADNSYRAYITSLGTAYYGQGLTNFKDKVDEICNAEYVATHTMNSIACNIVGREEVTHMLDFDVADRAMFNEEDGTVGTTFTGGVVTLREQEEGDLVSYGAAYCWGQGDFGSLGDNNTAAHSLGLPGLVGGNKIFSSLDSGSYYTCAIEDGTNDAYCWGQGEFGKLGDNNTAAHNVGLPQIIQGNKKFSIVSAGGLYNCGLELATNDAYCWGNGEFGRLGDNNTAAHNVGLPTLVQGGKKFSFIYAGVSHTCGLELTTNDAYCWGEGLSGKLGDNNTAAHNVGLPGLVQGSKEFSSIALGADYTCALEQTTNDTYCWGQGWGGRLGDNNTNDHNVGLPGLVQGGKKFSSLTTGGWHTCGLEQGTNDAYCWGYGNLGKLGDNNLDAHYVGLPGLVQGGKKFSFLSAGSTQSNHMCAKEQITNDVYCWGIGWNGRLGDNILGDHNIGLPSLVLGSKKYASINAGLSHTCSIVPALNGSAPAYYVTTTALNNLQNVDIITSVDITASADEENRTTRWLVSLDGKAHNDTTKQWKKMTAACTFSDSTTTANLATHDFSADANTFTEIETWMVNCVLPNGSNALDFAIDLGTTDGNMPSVNAIIVNYYPEME